MKLLRLHRQPNLRSRAEAAWWHLYVKTHRNDARIIKACFLTSAASSLPMPSWGGQRKISCLISPPSESNTIRQNGEFVTFLRVMIKLWDTKGVFDVSICNFARALWRMLRYLHVRSMDRALIKMAAISCSATLSAICNYWLKNQLLNCCWIFPLFTSLKTCSEWWYAGRPFCTGWNGWRWVPLLG